MRIEKKSYLNKSFVQFQNAFHWQNFRDLEPVYIDKA